LGYNWGVKNKFKEYYRLSEVEFDEMWKTAFIVLDANVLLDLYRFSRETSDELLKILELLSDKLWMPHQAGLEYHKNKFEVISGQENFYPVMKAALVDCKKIIEKTNVRDKSYLVSKKQIKGKIELIDKFLLKKQRELPKWREKDEINEKLIKIYDGRVGDPYNEEELKDLYAEGDKRYLISTPPGYEDAGKPIPHRYGDFVLWKQIIDQAKTTKNPIIMVGDDNKEDWWLKISGKKISPRFELIKEMKDRAGVDFYLYEVENFMEIAKNKLGLSGGEINDAIREVKETKEKNDSNNLWIGSFPVSFSDEAVIYSGTSGYNGMIEVLPGISYLDSSNITIKPLSANIASASSSIGSHHQTLATPASSSSRSHIRGIAYPMENAEVQEIKTPTTPETKVEINKKKVKGAKK